MQFNYFLVLEVDLLLLVGDFLVVLLDDAVLVGSLGVLLLPLVLTDLLLHQLDDGLQILLGLVLLF